MICEYVRDSVYEGIVCFSCGNAAKELRRIIGQYWQRGILPRNFGFIAITPPGSDASELHTEDWWTQRQIKKIWPYHFDATSGHLPMEMMVELGQRLARDAGLTQYGGLELKDNLKGASYRVPTGSGETIIALSMAYPELRLFPIYSPRDPACVFDPEAVLNPLVNLLVYRALQMET